MLINFVDAANDTNHYTKPPHNCVLTVHIITRYFNFKYSKVVYLSDMQLTCKVSGVNQSFHEIGFQQSY